MAMSPQESRRRVLVVEDERPIRELLRLHLSLAAVDVVELGDGKEALDRTRTASVRDVGVDVAADRLTIRVDAEGDVALERYTADARKGLLEHALDIEVVIA